MDQKDMVMVEWINLVIVPIYYSIVFIHSTTYHCTLVYSSFYYLELILFAEISAHSFLSFPNLIRGNTSVPNLISSNTSVMEIDR